MAESLRVAGMTMLTRVALLLALGRLLHGKEFTDDVDMLARLADAPFRLLLGDTRLDAQHPPLLGLIEAVVYRPAHLFFSRFYAIRLTFIFYEALTTFLVARTLQLVDENPRSRRWKYLAWIVFPMGWMTSTVMAQDETVAGAFVALVMWLHVSGRSQAALLAASVGVVAGKIFLLLTIPALVLLSMPEASWKRRFVLAGAAPAAVYLWIAAAARLRGNPLPLVGFEPSAAFGITGWTLMSVPTHTAAVSSKLLVLLAIAIVLWLARVERIAAVAAMGATFMWTFAIFYHIDPEYYFFAMPVLALWARKRSQWALIALYSSVPWAVNFVYGVRNAISSPALASGGKAVFVRLYGALIPVEPPRAYTISLCISIGATIYLAIVVTDSARRLVPAKDALGAGELAPASRGRVAPGTVNGK